MGADPTPIEPQGELTAHAHLVHVEGRYSSPLPPPSLVAAYEELCPGAAEKIIGWVDAEGEHRRSIAREDQHLQGRGQVLAFLGVVLTFGLAFALVFKGAAVPAASLAGGVMALLTGAFVWDRRRARPKD